MANGKEPPKTPEVDPNLRFTGTASYADEKSPKGRAIFEDSSWPEKSQHLGIGDPYGAGTIEAIGRGGMTVRRKDGSLEKVTTSPYKYPEESGEGTPIWMMLQQAREKVAKEALLREQRQKIIDHKRETWGDPQSMIDMVKEMEPKTPTPTVEPEPEPEPEPKPKTPLDQSISDGARAGDWSDATEYYVNEAANWYSHEKGDNRFVVYKTSAEADANGRPHYVYVKDEYGNRWEINSNNDTGGWLVHPVTD